MTRAVAPMMAVVVLAVVAAGVAVDVLVPITVAPEGPGTATLGPDEGAWYCAVGDTTGESTMETSAVGAADRASTLRLELFADGEVTGPGQVEIDPGTVERHAADPDVEAIGVLAVWSEAAAIVARTWDRQVDDGPDGTVHGPCVATTTGTWYLAGVQTTGGSVARLEVANPFGTDAAISVQLLTADGIEEPELLGNIGVSARTVRSIELNEFAPEREDLGAIVTTRSGRVIVEGWQSVDPGVGDVSGVTLVPLVPDPEERWTVPLVPEGATASWLTVANPGDQSASVSLTVHTDDGGELPEGFEEVTVDAGSVRRIDLAGALPEDVDHGAVTVVSENGVPVVVNLAARFEHDDVERTGHVVLTGLPRGDDRWILPGLRSGSDRVEVLQLVNIDAEVATVDVHVATAAGTLVPESLEGLEVRPGAVTRIVLAEHLEGIAELDDPESDREHAFLVRSDGVSIVAGLHSWTREGALRPVALAGAPSAIWQPQVERRPIDHDPSLTRRIGTRLGPHVRADESPGPVPTPTPSPAPTEPPDG